MISAVSVLYFYFHLVTPKIICNSCILCRWRRSEDLAIFKGKKFVRLEKSVQGLTNKNKMADLVSIAMNLWKKKPNWHETQESYSLRLNPSMIRKKLLIGFESSEANSN